MPCPAGRRTRCSDSRRRPSDARVLRPSGPPCSSSDFRRSPACPACEMPRRGPDAAIVGSVATMTNAVAAELLERNRARIARAEAQLLRVRNAQPPFSETNVLRPFNEIGIEVSSAASECGLMAEVHPDGEVRSAADTVIQELSAFTTRLGQDRPLYDALGSLEPSSLATVPRRVVEL